MLKVVKFGGTSLADAQQIRKAGQIIKNDISRKFVVPSAPGKRFSTDEKITDMLYMCHDLAAAGKDISSFFDRIAERYTVISDELNLSGSISAELAKVKQLIQNGASRDWVASRGEYLNGLIMAEHLGMEFIDAAELVFFDAEGRFMPEETNIAASVRLSRTNGAVIPGFYGAMPDGSIKTFSRGGSDITGSIIARAVKADLYENWTDVSGFLVADPRIVKDPRVIRTITYGELRELSYMGATVLHEDAVFPVRISGIPINIKNTNAPNETGTMIVSGATDANPGAITGVAGRKGFTAITLEKDKMNSELGFVRKVLSVLEKYNIPIEHLPSGIDTLTVIFATNGHQDRLKDMLNDIKQAVSPDAITVESELALVATVGRGMKQTVGTAARVTGALARNGVNIHMIDQGSSEMNIIIGVVESDFENAIRAIYKEFVG